MSTAAKIGVAFVVITTAASETIAIATYRHSTDGQTAALWLIIVVYGVLAVGAIWLLDVVARKLRDRTRHT